jgi:hypothetical protein
MFELSDSFISSSSTFFFTSNSNIVFIANNNIVFTTNNNIFSTANILRQEQLVSNSFQIERFQFICFFKHCSLITITITATTTAQHAKAQPSTCRGSHTTDSAHTTLCQCASECVVELRECCMRDREVTPV